MPKEDLGADLDVVDAPLSNAAALLFWDHYQKLAQWGKDGWTRAATAKAFCK